MSQTKVYILVACLLGVYINLNAQDRISNTFRDTRIINAHSVETLPDRKLDVRITHRFGDLAGDNGGFQTLYGLENASDVMIGAEYGWNDNLTIGLFRTKGAGSYPSGDPGLNQLLNGVVKQRILWQTTDNKMPVSLTFVGIASMSTARAIEGEFSSIQNFPSFSHRLAYTGQLLLARKYSFGLSLQLTPSYTYRNLVLFNDSNGIFSLGGAARMQVSKFVGVIVDATFPFSDIRNSDNGFYPAIGLGVEIDTGGHVFQINLTNAQAISENDYIPYTTSNWLDGEFRLGFTISRLFNL